MTWRIDQVDQEILTIGLLANNVLDVLGVVKMTVQGDGGRLDGDTTLLLIGTSICSSGITSLCGGNNTGLGEEGVGQGRLAVIDVGNDGHVTDIAGLVHQSTDLVDGEAKVQKEKVVSCGLFICIPSICLFLHHFPSFPFFWRCRFHGFDSLVLWQPAA